MSALHATLLIQLDGDREVERLLADGLVERLLPPVVGPAGCSVDARLRADAAVLALPERVRRRGVVAQAAAAWVWCGGTPPPVVDVAVAPGRALAGPPTLAVHERRMPPADVTHLPTGVPGAEPLAVTTPTRTVADLLRLLPAPLALGAAQAVAGAGVTRLGVQACLAAMPRARGLRQARGLLDRLAFEPQQDEPAGGPQQDEPAGGPQQDEPAGCPRGDPSGQSIRLPVIR